MTEQQHIVSEDSSNSIWQKEIVKALLSLSPLMRETAELEPWYTYSWDPKTFHRYKFFQIVKRDAQ